MIKLVTVVVVCLVLAVQAVKSDECSRGPEHWCQSIGQAVQCGAFKHCLDSVWTKHARFVERPSGPDGISLNPSQCQNCVLCLQSNIQKCPMAQKHMKEVREMVDRDVPRRTICELLNHCDKPQSSAEETKAKNYFDSIKIKFFDSPNTVVQTPLSHSKTLAETGGMGCELCNIVFTAAKFLIENKVEQKKVFGFVEEQLCARLGVYNSTCVELIEQEGAELLAILAKSFGPAEVCRKIGLCSKNQIGTAERPVELFNLNVEKSNANCTLCKLTLMQIKQMLLSGKSQKQILDYFNTNLCARVGKSKDICENFVDNYGPVLLELIGKDINPDQLCIMLGFCATSQIRKFEFSSDLQVPGVKSDTTCAICEFALNLLVKYVNQNTTAPEVEKWLEYVCNTEMPKPLRNECSTFVATYGPVIISLLIKQVDPKSICTTIGACSKISLKVIEMPVAKAPIANKLPRVKLSKNLQVPSVKGDTTCVICEFAMNLLVKYVNQNTSAPEVEKWLEYICNTEMPKPLRNECNAFVATYGPVIISLLIKQVDPKTICTTIGACSKSQTGLTAFDNNLVKPSSEEFNHLPVAQAPKPKKEITCSLCKLVMQYIDDKMEIDRTQQLLQLSVDNMCGIVPKRLRSECQAMVDKYGSRLLDFITQHTDPDVVCAHFKACKADEIDWTSIQEGVHHNKGMVFTGNDDNKINGVKDNVNAKNGTLECTLCLYVAELVDSLLKQNKTDQEIVAELKQVCNIFPSSLKDQCNAFINEYGAYVIQVLAADLDPQATCALLKLCDASIIGNRPRKTRYPF